MATRARCLCSWTKAPVHRTQWRRIRITRQYYTTDALEDSGDGKITAQPTNPENTEWFQTLREEMLNRELPLERDAITYRLQKKLDHTLYSFFPQGWHTLPTVKQRPIARRAMPSSIGEHIIFCNPAIADDKLLPDGTDRLHTPGGSFVRRMWAGGAVRVDKSIYFKADLGWTRNKDILCSERIKDVKLRGQGEKEKIFITIERKFARFDPVSRAMSDSEQGPGSSKNALLRRKMLEWEKPFLTEDRNIVFMRERSPEELQDIRVGKMTPIKYLPSLGQPDFSHTLTPTSTLLARFSALTFNAHLIHLDRDFARNVEGHRNILVHGPLTQTLMLKFLGSHLEALLEGPQIVEALEYRNLAPLYCGEEMRLCAREKEGTRMADGKVYDIWIEGPTGGMAVKGIARTGKGRPPRVSPTPTSETPVERDPQQSRSEESNNSICGSKQTPTTRFSRGVVSSFLGRNKISRHDQSTYRNVARQTENPLSDFAVPSTRRVKQSSASFLNRKLLRKFLRAHRLQYIQGHRNFDPHALRGWLRQVKDSYLNPTGTWVHGPIIRAVHNPVPMKSFMKLADRNILLRTMRTKNSHVFRQRIEPVPIVRYHFRDDWRYRRLQDRGPRRLMAKPVTRKLYAPDTWESVHFLNRVTSRARRRAAKAGLS